MSLPARRLFSLPRPAWSLATASRGYATIPTKNPNPTPPIEPSNEQAMPLGRFYEHVLNKPQPYADKKPERPATSTVEATGKPASTPKTTAAKGGREAKDEPSTSADASSAAPPKKSSSSAKPKAASSSSSSVSPSPPAPPPSPPTSAQEKAKVIFGSSLAGPAQRAERLAELKSRTKTIAGVSVPPKPEEPDNCCMSGCVNCVWDLFRDEMETWAAADAEVKRRLALKTESKASSEVEHGRKDVSRPPTDADSLSVSMDDDGGGSTAAWESASLPSSSETISKDLWDEELYKNVPVGIREFMKSEKRLKAKHVRDGTSGG